MIAKSIFYENLCEECNASGQCTNCDGNGEREMKNGDMVQCDLCQGSGDCPDCEGYGTTDGTAGRP